MTGDREQTALLIEMSQALGRLEGKLDDRNNKLDDHENRLRALEKWRWVQVGVAATLGWAAANIEHITGLRIG